MRIAFCSLCTVLSLAVPSLAAERAPWERTAEEELGAYLKRVASEGVRIGGKKAVFHVGDTEFARGKGLASSAFKDEEWCAKSFGADVVLNGGGTRGALYAVYHFLEDDCGIRWWNDGDEDVPEKGRIDFPALDRRGKPFFAYREIYRTPTATIDPRTAVRMRLNGNGERKIPLAWGGGVEFGPPYFTHVWDRYLPFAKYGKEHPEWYSYREKEGRRVGGIYTGQLCLTNPELVPLLVKLVKESIARGEAEAKAKGLAAPTIYALNMNDNRNYCECEACKAEVAKYGHSGQQLRFINAIAAEVGKDRPDLRFKFSAYLYTEEPPKGGVKAADNVIVDIAMTQTNLAGPISDRGNDHIREMPVRWRDAAHQFLVWDYGITFWPTTMGWPFPGEFHLPGKMRHFADCGVTHFFIEHEYPETADMYELKLYLERKLLEDPYADGDGLIGTFMREYYGPASASVLAARTLLEDVRRSVRAQVSWFPRRHEFTWIDDATVAAIRGRFDDAEKAVAGNGKLLQRVRRARTSIDRVAETRRTFRGYAGRYPAKEFNPQDKKAMELVDAVDALDGKALRIKADGERYSRKNLMTCGYALGGGSGILAAETDEKEGEWRWYRASKLKASEGYIHCCNWQVQIETGLPGNKGRKTDLRVHMRLTGPNFFPGSTRPNEVLIDRIEELPVGGPVTVGYDAGNLPKIFVDGKPQHPFIDLCGCANYVGQQWVSDYVARAKDVAGPRIWSVGFEDKDYLKADGTRDWTFLDEKVASLLKADPDAQLMLFIRFRYERWAKEHPEECVGYAGEAKTPGSPDEWAGVPVRPSSASIPFRAEVFKDLRTMADYVKAAPWGDRVIGTRICYGVATEWFTYGTCAFPDNGVAMTKEFRRWLRRKYGTDEALRTAWADDAVSLETVEIPSKEVQAPKTLFLDPLRNRRTIDFNEMSADSMADLLIAVARETKRVLPGRLVGAYYGYILNAWPGNSANFLVDKVLASGQIDFLSDMADYSAEIRRAGGGYDHKAVVATLTRYGKIEVLEDDSRFHYMTNWTPSCVYISRTAREDAAILKRNILNTLFDREGYQVCDPIAGKGKPGRLHAFDNANVLAVQRETFGVLKDVKAVTADSGADMALVVNYRDKFYGDTHKFPPGGRAGTWWETYRGMPAGLHRSGAVFDILTLDDLLASKKRYRRLVFINGFALTDAERRGLKELTRAPGVTAVWFIAPGSITARGFSDEAMSDLVGMRLRGAAANPQVVCSDAAANPVAVAKGGWMKKLDGGATAFFFPEVLKSASDCAALVESIGEHRYAAPGAYVRRRGDYLMLHVGEAGRYALTLPDSERTRSLKELFSGRTYGPDARTFETDGPETWFFEVR